MAIHHLLMKRVFMMISHVGRYKIKLDHDRSCYDQFQIVSKSSNGMRNWSSYLHRDSKSRNWTKFSREIIVLIKIFELLDKVNQNIRTVRQGFLDIGYKSLKIKQNIRKFVAHLIPTADFQTDLNCGH